MDDAADQEKRSREIADTRRRLLLALNTGGIGAAFAFAGSLAAQKVPPAWVTWPVAWFLAGLIVTAISLFLAQHRALRRRDAASERRDAPKFTAYLWRSSTWEMVALAFFILGAIAGLVALQGIVLK